jgi:phosphoribosylformylglycinamidine synthase
MLALVAPDQVDEAVALCERWGVRATPIGSVTDDDRLVFLRHGDVVHDAPARALADEGPVYERPLRPWRHPNASEDVDELPAPDDLHAAAMQVLTSPNVVPATWISNQYDSIVGSGTVQGCGASAAVLRLPPRGGWGAVADERRGVAIATDGNGRWCALDPERGAQLIVAEAARNVACTGARPLAATNCLNFGSPETPEVMGAFSATIDGMAAACLALGTPITGGNVSFYNATDGQSIHPTPIVGVLGTIDDCARSVPHTLRAAGDAIYIIGAVTRPGLGGSEYLWRTAGQIAGRPAAIDLREERRLHELLVRAAGDGLLSSAHDVATGGLLTTLVETCGDRLGAAVVAEGELPAHQWLFSESPTRVVVSADQTRSAELTRLCHDAGVACIHLGTATTERRLMCGDLLELDLDMVASAQAQVLPDLLDAR